MAKFSAQTLVEEILNNPQAVKIVESLVPGITKNPALKLVKKLPLEKLAALPQAGLSKENLAKLIKELNEKIKG